MFWSAIQRWPDCLLVLLGLFSYVRSRRTSMVCQVGSDTEARKTSRHGDLGEVKKYARVMKCRWRNRCSSRDLAVWSYPPTSLMITHGVWSFQPEEHEPQRTGRWKAGLARLSTRGWDPKQNVHHLTDEAAWEVCWREFYIRYVHYILHPSFPIRP